MEHCPPIKYGKPYPALLTTTKAKSEASHIDPRSNTQPVLRAHGCSAESASEEQSIARLMISQRRIKQLDARVEDGHELDKSSTPRKQLLGMVNGFGKSRVHLEGHALNIEMDECYRAFCTSCCAHCWRMMAGHAQSAKLAGGERALLTSYTFVMADRTIIWRKREGPATSCARLIPSLL